jgi:hypothetical protein
MKKMIVAACAALSIVMSGCKTVPTSETVNNVSFTIGASTALVVKMMKLDEATMNSVNMVLANIKSHIPEDGQTFETLWTPVAVHTLDKLVADGKITAEKRLIAEKAVGAIIKGMDRLFEKHEEWKQYGDLVKVGIDGFMNGYNTVFKYKNSSAAENADEAETEIICKRAGVVFDPDVR